MAALLAAGAALPPLSITMAVLSSADGSASVNVTANVLLLSGWNTVPCKARNAAAASDRDSNFANACVLFLSIDSATMVPNFSRSARTSSTRSGLTRLSMRMVNVAAGGEPGGERGRASSSDADDSSSPSRRRCFLARSALGERLRRCVSVIFTTGDLDLDLGDRLLERASEGPSGFSTGIASEAGSGSGAGWETGASAGDGERFGEEASRAPAGEGDGSRLRAGDLLRDGDFREGASSDRFGLGDFRGDTCPSASGWRVGDLDGECERSSRDDIALTSSCGTSSSGFASDPCSGSSGFASSSWSASFPSAWAAASSAACKRATSSALRPLESNPISINLACSSFTFSLPRSPGIGVPTSVSLPPGVDTSAARVRPRRGVAGSSVSDFSVAARVLRPDIVVSHSNAMPSVTACGPAAASCAATTIQCGDIVNHEAHRRYDKEPRLTGLPPTLDRLNANTQGLPPGVCRCTRTPPGVTAVCRCLMSRRRQLVPNSA